MITQKSQSTARPPEWDTDSSPAVVYHNVDVAEVPASEDTPAMYNYTQEVYTRQEYAEHLGLRNELRTDGIEATLEQIQISYLRGVESA